jgi:hypothetical protein
MLICRRTSAVCVSAQVGEGKYGDVNCYGPVLDGRALVIKLVPVSKPKAVRRLEWEAGMLVRAQPALGRTLPRAVHWAVDKQVCRSRSVCMCLRLHFSRHLGHATRRQLRDVIT